MSSVKIRKFEERDKPKILEIVRHVISKGDSFAHAPEMTDAEILGDWCSGEKHTFIAEGADGAVLGTYYIKSNQIGLGSHIANAGYMVAPEARQRGIGRLMGEHSLQAAKDLGFHAMQFNFVVKSNEKAVKLWRSLGFEIIGEIPEAFRHLENGLTNAYIMYRKL